MNKSESVKLSTKDKLSMFRCAIYTKMEVANTESKPTDHQCIQWLQRVCAQAEHRKDPSLSFVGHEPIKVKSDKIILEIEIRRWDAVVLLPEWRDLAP